MSQNSKRPQVDDTPRAEGTTKGTLISTDSIPHLVKHYTSIGFGLVQLNGKKPYVEGWQDDPITDPAAITGNVGLNHQASRTATLDLDHMSARYALQLVGIDLEQILADAPFAIIGDPDNPPKPLYHVPDGIELSVKRLRWPDPDKLDDPKARLTIFELRASGGQDALPPSVHPDTKQPYIWRDDKVPMSYEDIPIVPDVLLDLWQNWTTYQEKFVCPWANEAKMPKSKQNGKHSDNAAKQIGMAFNNAHKATDILSRNGYKPVGKKWLAPSSTSGNAGVMVLPDGNILSFHGSDALADDLPHDAFDCYRILEHGGEWPMAIEAAKALLGIEVSPAPSKNGASADDEQAEDMLPEIQTNARHHHEVSDEAYQALVAANEPPFVFVRGAQLTRVRSDEHKRPVAEPMAAETTQHHLDRVAKFYTLRRTANGDIRSKGTLPMAIVKDLMSFPQWPELPPLLNVVSHPFFTPDGELVTAAGYNPATMLYHYPDQLHIGDTEPTSTNLAKAKSLIVDQMLADFPFVDEASRDNAIALLLLPFVRPAIEGCTPMHIIDAPSHGTGKGLLARALTKPSAPQGPMLMTVATDEDEMRKRLTSTLMTGASHVLIDNIPDTLDSGQLAAVLTADFFTDRILGVSKVITLPVRNIWLGTGNNTVAHGELARRIIWTRIDARVEQPWKRKGFKIPNLDEWLTINRGELVTAALTLIRLWFEVGCPSSGHVLGSYERWAKVMGGILATAGFDNFMSNADQMYERANMDRQPWVAFVEQWAESHQFKRVGTDKLFPIASEYDAIPENDVTKGLNLLGEFIEGHTQRSRQIKLGKLLRANVDKVFGNYRIIAAGELSNAAQYRLEQADKLF